MRGHHQRCFASVSGPCDSWAWVNAGMGRRIQQGAPSREAIFWMYSSGQFRRSSHHRQPVKTTSRHRVPATRAKRDPGLRRDDGGGGCRDRLRLLETLGDVGTACGCWRHRSRPGPHPGPLPGGEGEEHPALCPAGEKSTGAEGGDCCESQPRRIHHRNRPSSRPRASATLSTAPKRVFWPGRALRS
jgi:hypothetical protein